MPRFMNGKQESIYQWSSQQIPTLMSIKGISIHSTTSKRIAPVLSTSWCQISTLRQGACSVFWVATITDSLLSLVQERRPCQPWLRPSTLKKWKSKLIVIALASTGPYLKSYCMSSGWLLCRRFTNLIQFNNRSLYHLSNYFVCCIVLVFPISICDLVLIIPLDLGPR